MIKNNWKLALLCIVLPFEAWVSMELIANSETAKCRQILTFSRKEMNHKNCSGDHNDGPKDAR